MKVIVSLFLFLIATASPAQINRGMQTELSEDHLEKTGYIPFENFRTRPRAPIAAGIKIDGRPVSSMEEIFTYFSEEVGAWLPEKQTIKSTKDDQGREIWDYPIGTRVIHYITLNDAKSSSFELRMIERVEEGRWAFGVYVLDEGRYKLQNYQGLKPAEFKLEHRDGNNYKVNLKHIPLHVCQNCHNNTTSAPWQYQSRIDVGPCEFTPANPKVQNEWVKKFTNSRGYEPIEKQ